MPVGEVGKNLQTITGCESLSKRLKEQFGGLKKAIETSKCASPLINHNFNTVIKLDMRIMSLDYEHYY